MFWPVVRPARQIAAALIDNDSPRQLALALVLGMMLGLLPKSNLTALMLGSLLLFLRVNLGLGLASALAFTWLGFGLDEAAHRVGWLVLRYEPLQPTYAYLHGLPLADYSGLNNTVVVGQLLIGAYFAYPTYWIGLFAFRRLRPRLSARLRRQCSKRLPLGIEQGSPMGTSDS